MKGNFDSRYYNHKVNLCDNCQRTTHTSCDGVASFHPKYEDKWFCCQFCLHEFKTSRGSSARDYVSEIRKRRKKEKMRNLTRKKLRTSVTDLFAEGVPGEDQEHTQYDYDHHQEEDYNSLNPQTYQ